MKKLLILLFLISNVASAKPASFEVWFLSIDKQSVYRHFEPANSFKTSRAIASNDHLQCQPMGEYCFDPQVGLYKKDDKVSAKDSTVDQSIVDKSEQYDFLPTGDSVNRNLINCSKSNNFDIFCGKSRKKAAAENIKLEVWIDVSTTMKQVDFNGFNHKCNRELFLEQMSESCPMNQNMKVYYFNEVRKEAGSFDRACISNGLNNMKRLLDDIKKIDRKRNLIVVTDIFEASAEFISNIEKLGGSVRGVDEPIYAKNLLSEMKRIKTLCK